MLEELVRAGAVEVLTGDRVRPLASAYRGTELNAAAAEKLMRQIRTFARSITQLMHAAYPTGSPIASAPR
jgi:hypothetical protein